MKTIKLVLCLSILMMIGCKKDDKSAQKEEIQEKKIQEIIPGNYLNVLKEMGMPIHEGINPPDITGIYHISPIMLLKTNITSAGEYEVGHRFADGRYSFSSLNKNDFTLKVASKQGPGNSESTIAAISGSGSHFTVYAMEISTSGTNSAIFAYLYSGILEGSSIKDFKMAFINVDNSNGGIQFIKEGEARITHDEDGISERVNSLDITAKTTKILEINPAAVTGLSQMQSSVR